ncbi:MAG: GNAT family N-acetyltransferase [Deltaproteobacteria bacterium]|nr:GNAT family N-acetyltransferase [Deltaproteobacteria bacterium]
MEKQGLNTGVIATLSGLEEIRDEWTELWKKCGWATPFQAPQWLIPWWRHFGKEGLFTVTVRTGGRLTGLAPFFIYSPLSDIRRMIFIGTGISDYLDILFEPGSAEIVAEAILDRLLKSASMWDRCELDELRAGSPLLTLKAPEGFDIRISDADICPFIKLPQRAGELYSGLSPKYRRKVSKGKREMAATGGLRVEEACKATLREFLTDLFALHGARWGGEGLPGVLSDNNLQRFHFDAAEGLYDIGCLRLHRLVFKGENAAALYSLIKGGQVFCYLSGFEPKFGRFSPGRYLMAYAIERAIEEGFEIFDFMRGGEPYKYFWGAVNRVNYRFVLAGC